jgi:hypothetical protein
MNRDSGISGTDIGTPPKRRFWKVERIFLSAFTPEALFNGVSTRFGLRIVERILPKSSFGEHKLCALPRRIISGQSGSMNTRFGDSARVTVIRPYIVSCH